MKRKCIICEDFNIKTVHVNSLFQKFIGNRLFFTDLYSIIL